MKNFYFILIMFFGLFSNTQANNKLAYEFSFKKIDGGNIDLSDYKNKVILVVNVASRCGFTPQYEGLQKLWAAHQDEDFVIIGIPTNNFNQEPGTNKEIKSFCETNFNIKFPMSEKINVLGGSAHPFFKWAKESYGLGAIPKWNFHKIVISKNGEIIKTFSSLTNPSSKKFVSYIKSQIKN